LLEAGILEIFLDKIPQETKFKFNGISNEAPQDLIKGGTIIFNHKDQEQINLKTVKIKNEIYHIFKDNLYSDKAMEINPKGLYKFHKSGVNTRLLPIYTPLQVLSVEEGSDYSSLKQGYSSVLFKYPPLQRYIIIITI